MITQDIILNIFTDPTYSKIITGYIIFINFIGFAVMGIDKKRAINDEWRIPEKNLFLCSLLGGSLGTWGGMYFWGHKTRKFKFIIGMPVILMVHVLVIIYLMFLL